MRFSVIAILCLASFAGACSPSASVKTTGAPSQNACPDDGPRFPGTGLCTGRISNYFDPEALAAAPSEAPKDCAWDFNETMIGDGSDAIIYRALSCKGVTTKLESSAGAHSATLAYETSAIFGDAAKGKELAHIFVSDPADPQKVIRDLIEGLPKAEQAKCEVQPANIEGWPKDALVIGYNAKAAQSLPKDEPNAVCGPFGRDEDSQTYWQIRHGFAWHWMLGQEQADFDPESMIFLRKGADGAWTAVN